MATPAQGPPSRLSLNRPRNKEIHQSRSLETGTASVPVLLTELRKESESVLHALRWCRKTCTHPESAPCRAEASVPSGSRDRALVPTCPLRAVCALDWRDSNRRNFDS